METWQVRTVKFRDVPYIAIHDVVSMLLEVAVEEPTDTRNRLQELAKNLMKAAAQTK